MNAAERSWDSSLSGDEGGKPGFGNPHPGMLDVSDGLRREMERADEVHRDMVRDGAESGMDAPRRPRQDHGASQLQEKERRCLDAIRRYMRGSVPVAVDVEGEGGGRAEFDCVEVLPCHHGVTLLQRADRAVKPPPDGRRCALSINGRSARCLYTGIGFRSPGLGLVGHVFIYEEGV